jgi:hypothetical protein
MPLAMPDHFIGALHVTEPIYSRNVIPPSIRLCQSGSTCVFMPEVMSKRLSARGVISVECIFRKPIHKTLFALRFSGR